MAGSKKASASKPAAVNLRGLMGREIAAMIAGGEITQAQAETFVARRAVEKLHKEQEKLQA